MKFQSGVPSHELDVGHLPLLPLAVERKGNLHADTEHQDVLLALVVFTERRSPGFVASSEILMLSIGKVEFEEYRNAVVETLIAMSVVSGQRYETETQLASPHPISRTQFFRPG